MSRCSFKIIWRIWPRQLNQSIIKLLTKMKSKNLENITIHFLTIHFQIEIFKLILLICMVHLNHIVNQHQIISIYRHLSTIKYHKCALRTPGMMILTYILISWQNMMDIINKWIRKINLIILHAIAEILFRK